MCEFNRTILKHDGTIVELARKFSDEDINEMIWWMQSQAFSDFGYYDEPYSEKDKILITRYCLRNVLATDVLNGKINSTYTKKVANLVKKYEKE